MGAFDWASLPPAAVAGLVFLLRTVEMTISTVRLLAVARGRRAVAWILGLSESLLFVIAFAGLLGTLGSPWNLVAFAVGFGTGNWLGITLESRLAPGHSLLRITSAHRPAAIADALRRAGHGATEVPGFGESGSLGLVISYVPRREVDRVRRLVLAVSPEAALTAENVRELRGGWRPAGRTRLPPPPAVLPGQDRG